MVPRVLGGVVPGYLDDPTVPKGSKTPTFATCVLRIHNERCAALPCGVSGSWAGL